MTLPKREVYADFELIDLPYPPSWIDRMIVWLEGLPGPAWLVYAVGLVVISLLINAVFWIDGSTPFGYFDPLNTTFAIFVVYWPMLYRYLTRVGSRALRAFRPLLEADDREVARIEYEITILPRIIGWSSIPLGYGLAILELISEPAPYGDIIPRTLMPYIGDIAISGFMLSAFFCLLIRSIRQLQMVAKLHAQATGINLMELNPAHAFSDLTARTGIGVILVLILSYPADPYAFNSALDVILFVTIGLLSITIFVLPVIGIQKRIEEEKERILSRTHQKLDVARDKLHKLIESNDYQDMSGIKDAIEALLQERALIHGISTWPWNPKTIRGFASALLLPIFLGLVTRLFETLL